MGKECHESMPAMAVVGRTLCREVWLGVGAVWTGGGRDCRVGWRAGLGGGRDCRVGWRAGLGGGRDCRVGWRDGWVDG